MMQIKIKRMLDIIIAIFLLAFFSPVWCGIAIIIRITSPGPIFFLQDRPGYKKKIFIIYKFRTMRIGSEKMIKNHEVMLNDERITKFGRFLRRSKLDEIPQLINVLKGDMSLVGPRPERLDSLKDYDDEISKRLDMLPGMTGLAQVSGNIYITLQERYYLDVYYVENFNLWLDVRILFRTFGVILLGEKHYQKFPLVNIRKEEKT